MIPGDMVRFRAIAVALGLMLVFAAAAAGQPAITGSLPGQADVGVPCPPNPVQLVTGGMKPYSYTITGASLTWLSFNPDGTVSASGSPPTTGTFSFTVQATDSAMLTSAAAGFTINVNPILSINPASLPGGQQGTPYSVTISGTNGTPPYGAVQLTGTLPMGLNFSNGTISGTPTQIGTFPNLMASVTDSVGGSASMTYSLVIVAPPLSVTPTPVPQGEVTASYPSTQLAASGGVPPYSWALASGSLDGLSLSAAGVISGTPIAAGSFPFTVTVTDSASTTATSGTITLTVIAAPTITPPSLPQGEVGATYSQALAATGGSGTGYVWSVSSGSLPAGLSLSAGGVISGTPTSAGLGTTSFTVQVTDSANGTATLVMSITIIAGPTITTPPTLPNGTVGAPYTGVTLAASGGTAPYTWSVTVGSLPPGLTLNGSTGAISGQPTASGTFNFTVQVTDAKSVTASKGFTIFIAAGLTITTAPGLPGATIGLVYSATVSAAGGNPPYTWSVTAGSLPGGLSLNASTGAIAGTPSNAGSFQFTLQVTDSTSVTATKQFTLAVALALAFTTGPNLPSAVAGAAYSQTLAVSGGTAPYTFVVMSGALPGGLSLVSSTGTISGTPASAGTFIFTVQVRDNNSSTASQQFTLIVGSGLTIATPSPLPPGAVNSLYSQTLSAAGGTAPYTWALTQGTLPAGLTLKGTTGIISGTPSANGNATFSVQVTDQTGATSTKQFSLTIGAGLVITSGATLPAGTLAQPYSPLALAVIGGTQPYTWSVKSGSMAPGLLLSAAGIISGMPTQAGAFRFTAQVKDASGDVVTQAFIISILPPALPQVNIAGVPQSSTAAQQISFSMALASAYPLDIAGQITLSFQPDAVAPATDPATQFSSGGTTVAFTIPANSLNAVFAGSLPQIGLQTGTISGTITLTFALTAGGAQLPATGLDRTITIPRSPPVIQSVKMVKNSTGFEIHVVAFSPSRDLTEADLTFTAAQGANLVTTSLTESLSSVAKAWYQGASSAQYGSQLMLVLPFTASQGGVDAVGSVAVVMKSSKGSSPSTSGTF